MIDYKELVAQLRAVGDHLKFVSCIYLAADAIEQLVKERDAAVADFSQFAIYAASKRGTPFPCAWCKSQRSDFRCQWFIDHKDDKLCSGDHFEWRGVKEDNDGLS